MMLNKFLPSKKLLVVGAAGVLITIASPISPRASADGGGGDTVCNGTVTQTGGIVTCVTNGGNGGNGGGTPIDHSWQPTLAAPGDGPCIDAQGNASYLTPLYQPSTGAIDTDPETTAYGSWPEPCTANSSGAPSSVALKAQAIATLTAPSPGSDYLGNFLTGAMVAFNAPKLASPPPLTVGAAFLTATPLSYTWDYGDGHTRTVLTNIDGTPAAGQLPPTHTYATVSPHSDNPDDHTVVVTVTGTWHLYFHQPSADPTMATQDLGNVTVVGTLQTTPATPPPATPKRTIVQVFSAQTESNS